MCIVTILVITLPIVMSFVVVINSMFDKIKNTYLIEFTRNQFLPCIVEMYLLLSKGFKYFINRYLPSFISIRFNAKTSYIIYISTFHPLRIGVIRTRLRCLH